MSRFAKPAVVGVLTALLCTVAALAADPKRYRTYYGIFNRGNTLIPGHDTRWVPQGLAYWPEKDALVIAYYDGTHAKRSRLAVIDRASGKRQKIIELPEKGHVGGLGISAGSLWVGTFNAAGGATAYHYRLGPKTETPFFDGRTLPAPSKVQGMAIAGGNVIWSRSFGRDNDSRLDVRRVSAPTQSVRSLVAPNMAEGLAVAGGELEVLYESGSAVYEDADYRVRTVHHGPLSKLAPAG
jgi:hypothetical protein